MTLLSALGLSRPMGEYPSRELAEIGLKSMEQADGYESGREIGKHFLGAIAENDRHRSERKIAHVARKAAEGTFPNSGFQVERLALATIAGGITGPVSTALASFGKQAMQLCLTPQEGRAVGYKVLKGIEETSDSPTAIRLAQVASNLADRNDIAATSAKQVERAALDTLSQGGALEQPDQAMAALGLQAAQTGNIHDDRVIGDVVLRAVVDNCEDPSTRILGETAIRASERVPSHFDAVEVQREALAGILRSGE